MNTQPSSRLVSLDVFRGLTVLLMIVVNITGGESFALLSHSEWNGCTLADLVFPFFLFIVGVAVPFALASKLEAGRRRGELLPHILRRTVAIFALGLALNLAARFDLSHCRIPGVLQRIAVCYLAASLLFLLSWTPDRRGWIRSLRCMVMIAAALLIGYWALLCWVPMPDGGQPGRNVPLLDPVRNLSFWVDRFVLHEHLLEGGGDPEGLLSTLAALADTLGGVMAGLWIRRWRQDWRALRRRLLGGAAICLLLGAFWALGLPLNKKLWTSSFALLSLGLALLALAVCFWLIEVRRWRGRWCLVPLVFGTNCLFAYAFSELVDIISTRVYLPYFGQSLNLKDCFNSFTFYDLSWPRWGALGYALVFTAFCWLVTWLLYRRHIFLKL